eukprot:2193439-Rhodomonas_salina.2
MSSTPDATSGTERGYGARVRVLGEAMVLLARAYGPTASTHTRVHRVPRRLLRAAHRPRAVC